MLNLDRLRALHAVSAHGSIIAAAETLNVTTSAVSQQLAKLELETGQTLLERHGRGVRLTDAAAALVLAHAARAVAARRSRSRARSQRHRGGRADHHRRVRHRRARAGAAGDARAAQEAIRSSAITFHEQEPHESIPRLVRRDVDVIIINDWQNAPIALPEGLTKAPLFDDVADIALPPGHRLAKAKTHQAERAQRRGVDRVAVGIDLPRLPDAHAAQGRATSRRSRTPPANTRRSWRWSRRASAAACCRGWAAARCRRASPWCRRNRRCAGTSTPRGARTRRAAT